MTTQEQIDAIVNATYKAVAGYIDEAIIKSCALITSTGKAEAFKLASTPALQAKIEEAFNLMAVKANNIIMKSTSASWFLANKNMDKTLDKYLKGKHISKDLYALVYQRNENALVQFIKRAEDGATVSDRVWSISNLAQSELAALTEEGLAVGKSAAKLSQDVRQILKEPDKLFRRVRDENGVLQLSKAARNYNPGQGVYRSSYMNAKRLTATEINMAYRSSDMERYNQIDFITGYEVVISNNHPKEDICDDLQGKYPKEFIFRGWHPFCRCHSESIMLSEDQFIKYLDTDKVPQRSIIQNIPKRADAFINDNMDTFKGWKNLPYFVSDNADYLGV
jgi:hypothetical protein